VTWRERADMTWFMEDGRVATDEWQIRVAEHESQLMYRARVVEVLRRAVEVLRQAVSTAPETGVETRLTLPELNC
jgi:hypothetical protein